MYMYIIRVIEMRLNSHNLQSFVFPGIVLLHMHCAAPCIQQSQIL